TGYGRPGTVRRDGGLSGCRHQETTRYRGVVGAQAILRGDPRGGRPGPPGLAVARSAFVAGGRGRRPALGRGHRLPVPHEVADLGLPTACAPGRAVSVTRR